LATTCVLKDLGQLLGDGDEHRDLAAADLIYDGLGLASLASSFHVDESVATRASWLFFGGKLRAPS
jgi:hypothetical protein